MSQENIKPENLLIVRTDRIGDVVLTLPLARLVREAFEGAKVSFLVRAYTEPLAKGNSYINEVLVLDEKNGKPEILKSVKKLRQRNFDSCIVVFPTFRIALIMLLSGIKYRIGTGYRWYSFLFNRKIYEHRKKAERHELEYNVNLLKFFGISTNVNRDNVRFDLQPDKGSVLKIEQLLSQNNVNFQKWVIIVHPGSGGSAVDLPFSSMKELVRLLARELNVTVILTGSAAEQGICARMAEGTDAQNFAGKMDLAGLTALIDRSDMLIANSTGPIHIAAALNKFTVGFYPKILTCSPERWGPYTNNSLVFSPGLQCTNCSRQQCEKLDCMSSIDVKMVFENIKSVMNKSGVFRRTI